MDIIILAGGKGSRMNDELPKPLTLVKNKPIISHQIDYLSSDVNKIILSIGYQSDKIVEYVEKHYDTCYKVDFSIEEIPLGTAGGLKNALKKSTTDYIIALNCDDITDINIKELVRYKANTICAAHPRLPFGRIKKTREGHAKFEEKPILEKEWANCGWYLFRRKGLEDILPDNGSLEEDVFPHFKFDVYEHNGLWFPLNTKKDIKEYEKFLNKS